MRHTVLVIVLILTLNMSVFYTTFNLNLDTNNEHQLIPDAIRLEAESRAKVGSFACTIIEILVFQYILLYYRIGNV